MNPLATDREITILLARQRSGTNALRQILGSHPAIFCTPEVFHARPALESGTGLAERVNFFRFLARNPERYVARAVSPERQAALFETFLGFVARTTARPHVVIDVKYNSTHHFDGPWQIAATGPAFLGLVKQHGLRVLRLTRENHLRYYLSSTKARLTRDWVGKPASGDAVLKLDVGEMLRVLEQCQREDAVIDRALGGYPELIAVEYADLFPVNDGPPAREPLARIANWLSVDPDLLDGVPKLRKQSSLPLSETIENYAEVEVALRGTPFERFLADEPCYRVERQA